MIFQKNLLILAKIPPPPPKILWFIPITARLHYCPCGAPRGIYRAAGKHKYRGGSFVVSISYFDFFLFVWTVKSFYILTFFFLCIIIITRSPMNESIVWSDFFEKIFYDRSGVQMLRHLAFDSSAYGGQRSFVPRARRWKYGVPLLRYL